MTTTTATLFTLPPHLRESIAALVAADIAPASLQADLKSALEAADVEEFEEEYDEDEDGREQNDQEGGKKIVMRRNEEKEKKSEMGTSDPKPPRAPRRKPATIDGDVLDVVATWAGSSRDALTSAGLGRSSLSWS